MNIQVKKRNSDSEISRERSIAGWSKWPTRQAHDLKTAGSNPAPALHVVSRQTKIIAFRAGEKAMNTRGNLTNTREWNA